MAAYSCPQTSFSASSSCLMVTVNPGKLTVLECFLNWLASTLLAMTKFSMTFSGEATQASSSSSAGSSKESPMGQMASTPWSGSRMIPDKNAEVAGDGRPKRKEG